MDIHENIGSFSGPFGANNGTQGDVTWDGAINVLDILQVADMIINNNTGFSDAQLWAAEINNDGTVDLFDLLLLVDIIMGDISPEEYMILLADINHDNNISRIHTSYIEIICTIY